MVRSTLYVLKKYKVNGLKNGLVRRLDTGVILRLKDSRFGYQLYHLTSPNSLCLSNQKTETSSFLLTTLTGLTPMTRNLELN